MRTQRLIHAALAALVLTLWAPPAHAGEAVTVQDALVRGYLTPTLRQKTKGDADVQRALIEMARRAEAIGAERRVVRRLQAEALRRNPERLERMHVAVVLSAARRAYLFDRRATQAVGQDLERALTGIEAERLVAMGLLTRAHVHRARLDRPVLQRLSDLAAAARALGVSSAHRARVQSRLLRAPTQAAFEREARRLVVHALGLPSAAHATGLAAQELLHAAAAAIWIEGGRTAITSSAFWRHAKRTTPAEALRALFVRHHPATSEALGPEAALAELLAHAGSMRTLPPEAAHAASPAEDPRLLALYRYVSHLLRTALPDVSLDPNRAGGLAAAVAAVAPALRLP